MASKKRPEITTLQFILIMILFYLFGMLGKKIISVGVFE